VAHTAAGKLQGYDDDAYWYEAAYAYGIANGINTIADSMRLPLDFSAAPGRQPLVTLVAPHRASAAVRQVYEDILDFYQTDQVPNIFQALAHDEGYMRDYWEAVRYVFSDDRLDRLTKEAVALAASMAVRSDYGVDLHLREVKRLGLNERGVMEVIQVVQLFSCYTKVADGLQLEPDFSQLLHAPR
jgi:alkylhydroperoxidase/carboxymuconolactone decarboxylase family protein YurZ